MRTVTLIAFIFLAVGVVAFGYQGISYTTREKVVDLGPMQLSADKTRTIPLTPIIGAVAIVGGVALLFLGRRKD